MLGSQTLEVVIGLIFIFLLLSLLATAINELIMSFFSFRGRDLAKAIKIMLDDRAAATPGGKAGQKRKNRVGHPGAVAYF
ncbi:MAG: hypothetical protein AVDCRST_MAG56-618 [uncultured Cytophagales bacterium]|uniref:Uncharacterized protein n=1 Tax=uncultured Cytophagales bacterium TaxID=158755 RepID=A0A6J4HGY9_9SPHI|nr:MAG: hypothetical protein AVDCRST_MAG56-618 [uncultured Cytophagales bacterium]